MLFPLVVVIVAMRVELPTLLSLWLLAREARSLRERESDIFWTDLEKAERVISRALRPGSEVDERSGSFTEFAWKYEGSRAERN